MTAFFSLSLSMASQDFLEVQRVKFQDLNEAKNDRKFTNKTFLLCFLFLAIQIVIVESLSLTLITSCSISVFRESIDGITELKKQKRIQHWDLWRENQKVEIINIFGTSKANRVAHEMITNCDQTEKN